MEILEHLDAIARAATPGPWHAAECGSESIDGGPCWCNVVLTAAAEVPEDERGVISSGSAFRVDAAHIAAFDPPTVLALLAVCKAARASVTVQTQAITDAESTGREMMEWHTMQVESNAALAAALKALEPPP